MSFATPQEFPTAKTLAPGARAAKQTGRVRLGSLEVAEVYITPTLAAEWMRQNSNFRPLNERRVARLAEEIAAFKWDLNGETIKFNSDGSLKDGQHRLSACIRANTAFSSLVVWGIPSDLSIDTGTSRQLADVLYSRGEKDVNVLAAAVRWVWKYEQGKLRDTAAATSHATLLEVLSRHPQLRSSVGVARPAINLLPFSAAIFLHYVFSLKDAAAANQFFEAFTTGINLQQDDPIFHLRRRLLKDKDSKKTKLRLMEKVALCIKAWNLWVNGRTTNCLKVTLTGPSPEAFPEIEGKTIQDV